MILIQLVLIVAILLLAAYLVKSRNSSKAKAYKKILLLLFVPVAIIFILFPNLASDIAHFLGVGRGADLLLYSITLVLIFVLFNNYLKDRDSQRRVVGMARKIAILEARLNDKASMSRK